MVPTAIAVNTLACGQAGGWFEAVTWLAVVGMLLIGVGQLLLVAGTINLQTSFITRTVGIIPVLI